ncbi:YgiT-type zinc finger protein [Nitrospiraceae bacterium AH_259_D15_M11_P09]|nr:YgiT-type zinc finger protein [Nitrospiraceae bacterium AH_259_D15_M11_P09]
MVSRRINQDFWIKKKLVVIENVPAGVCPQCGEKIVRAEVVSHRKGFRKSRKMTVPVIRFAEEVA